MHPSAETLSALAQALRLDAAERLHLFSLYERPVPDPQALDVEVVEEPLRRMLDSLVGQPAYVLGRRWDILAWNKAAEAVYGPYGRLEGDERNALHLVFVDPGHRRLLVDWEEVARASLAMFRTDYARYVGDDDFERLIARLTRLSPEFAQWWSRREVSRPLAGRKRLDHPSAGRLLFEHSIFGVGDAPNMKLVVFTPPEEDGSREKLVRLLASTGI